MLLDAFQTPSDVLEIDTQKIVVRFHMNDKIILSDVIVPDMKFDLPNMLLDRRDSLAKIMGGFILAFLYFLLRLLDCLGQVSLNGSKIFTTGCSRHQIFAAPGSWRALSQPIITANVELSIPIPKPFSLRGVSKSDNQAF